MFKRTYYVVILILYLFSTPTFSEEIPKHIGHWRIEVGPAGNEVYEPPPPPPPAKPPSEELLRVVRVISPPYTEIKRWTSSDSKVYSIRAGSGPEKYDFTVTTDGKVYLEYKNDSTNVSEKAGKLVLKGTKKSIPVSKVPAKTLEILKKVVSDTIPSQAWLATTVAGPRYVVVVGEVVSYARPDGQIQAIGRIKDGALNEIDPLEKKDKKQKEIMAETKKLLSKYRERFNYENQIKRLRQKPQRKDGSFRFVVMGDSRSNPELWFSIAEHINQLDPKPAFVINTGDIVPQGYAKEYSEYYIPPLMKTEIPFFVALGNHDIGSDGMALEYRYLFGGKSLTYYFNYGKIRFVFVDNVTAVRPYQETMKWLDNILAETPKGLHIIVSAHQPIATVERWAFHAWDKENSTVFADLMSKYKVSHVFFGHIHAYSTASLNGIEYTIAGGGGASLHERYGSLGNIHHYVICDVLPDGTIKQQVVRFYKED